MKLSWTRKHWWVAHLLIFSGLTSWGLAILTSRIWWIDPQYQYGLFQVLPTYFWLGLLLYVLGFLVLVREVGNKTFVILLVTLNIMIVGAAVFVEPNARVQDTWWHLGTAARIVELGTTGSIRTGNLIYLNWPGSFILTAVVSIVSNIPLTSYIRIFPLASSAFFSLGYYTFLPCLVRNELHRRLGAAVLVFLDPWLQFHNSPQAFGLMLLPLLLLCSTKTEVKWALISMLVFLSLVISHPTTSLFVLSLLIMWNILARLTKKHLHMARGPALLSLILLTAWTVYNSQIFDWNVLRFAESIGNLSQFEQSMTLVERGLGLQPSMLRLATALLAAVLGIAGLLLTRRNIERLVIGLGWTSTCVFIAIYDFFILRASFRDRTFTFLGLLTAPLMIELIFEHRMLDFSKLRMRSLVGLFTILLLASNLYGFYYLENDFVVNDSNIAAMRFAADHVPTRIFGNRVAIGYAFRTDLDVVFLYEYQSSQIPRNSFLLFDLHSLLSRTSHMKYSQIMKSLYPIYAHNNTANIVFNDGLFFLYYG